MFLNGEGQKGLKWSESMNNKKKKEME